MISFLNPGDESKRNISMVSRTIRSKSRGVSSAQISNYQIRQEIGTGSYAKVFRAIHKPTKQLVAVKVFNKKKLSRQTIEDVRRQIQIHKKLFHTNIARVYELFENQDKIYVFMEYCENGELFHYINSKGPLPQECASKIFKQILSAMKYLKFQRIFHRDIKCQNILFDTNWNAKLVDFGFATKEQDGNFSRTFCGSPSYTAPQIVLKKDYNAQMIDIWCLAVTLYAMLTARLPFDSHQDRNTRRNIIQFKYQCKKRMSKQVRQVFSQIFVQASERSSIQDLQESAFVQNACTTVSNFINTNTEEISVDSDILNLIESQFPDRSSACIIRSVTQLKLDQNCSLYYLMVQSAISRGQKVKSDISSPNFQKRKKKVSNIRLRKISGGSRKSLMKTKNTTETSRNSTRQSRVNSKPRAPLPSIDYISLKLMKRNQLPSSPKQNLNQFSPHSNRQ